MMNNFNDFMNSLSVSEINELFVECEQFSKTGVLPEEAKMRNLVHLFGQESTALTLQLYTGFVYRNLAQKFMRSQATINCQ